MSQTKTRQQRAFDDINELLGYYAKETKGETMAAQLGLLMGWMARIAATDWIVHEELDARLEEARRKNSSSGDTSKPPVRQPLPNR